MKNKEMAELFKTIADSFTRLSEIYSSAEEAEQPKPTGKKEKPAKAAEPSPVEESATEGNTEPVTINSSKIFL